MADWMLTKDAGVWNVLRDGERVHTARGRGVWTYVAAHAADTDRVYVYYEADTEPAIFTGAGIHAVLQWMRQGEPP
jgi:hypothetical protein